MIKRFLSIVFLIFFLTFFKYPVLADDNFDVAYDVTYRFNDNGNTLVTQTITLINKTTNLFATQYQGSIYGTIVGEINGFDKSGPIDFESEKTSDKETAITANFKEKTVGQGNSSNFSVNYTLSGLVTKNGRIKEIAIPRPSKNQPVLEYKVTVIVPQSMGVVGFVKPLVKYRQTASSNVFLFDTPQSLQGILIGIGDVAHYSFDITYHLTNSSLIKSQVDVAIPPDTSYQQVLYKDIYPKPENVVIDEDGNWIASFILGPREDKDVLLTGNVLIWTTPRSDFTETQPGVNHLSSNKYWEVGDSLVVETAKALKSPFDVYSYLVKNLTYNYSRVGGNNKRMGVVEILKDPTQAICMEFTDGFVALTRAIGVPAREVNGYAYTQDEFLKPLSLVADILHAWPEYWNSEKKEWIPVDPTWGNTTGGIDYFNSLDFNHFVFARHGVSSTYPPAAGSYKITGDEKDVLVTPQNELPNIPSSEIQAVFDMPKAMFAGESQKVLIALSNNGGTARYNIPISIESEDFTVDLPQNTINLPAFSSVSIEGTITPHEKVWGEAKVIATGGDTREEVLISVSPKQALQLPVIVIIFLVFMFLLIYFVRRKHVKKRRI